MLCWSEKPSPQLRVDGPEALRRDQAFRKTAPRRLLSGRQTRPKSADRNAICRCRSAIVWQPRFPAALHTVYLQWPSTVNLPSAGSVTGLSAFLTLQSETRRAVREQSAAQFVDDQVGIASQQIEGGQTVQMAHVGNRSSCRCDDRIGNLRTLMTADRHGRATRDWFSDRWLGTGNDPSECRWNRCRAVPGWSTGGNVNT